MAFPARGPLVLGSTWTEFKTWERRFAARKGLPNGSYVTDAMEGALEANYLSDASVARNVPHDAAGGGLSGLTTSRAAQWLAGDPPLR